MGWRRVRRGVEWGIEFFLGTPSDNYRQVASVVPVVFPEVFRFNRRTRRLDAGP